MKSYTGHHTCKQDGGEEFVLANAPFLSKIEKNKLLPFLGQGYYFWDFDLDQAKRWGVDHCDAKYFIIEASINTTEENFLDLAGDRKHMQYFLGLAKRFTTRGLPAFQWRVGKLVEFLKQFAKSDTAVFPFQIIRAQDYAVYIDPQFKFFFRDENNYTYLNPRYVFCLLIVNDVILSGKTIIFPLKK